MPPRFPIPEIADDAKRDLAKLSWHRRARLKLWLWRLTNGGVTGRVTLYEGVKHDPPWKQGEYKRDLIVIFRKLTEEERSTLGRDPAPLFVVGRIAPPGELAGGLGDGGLGDQLAAAKEREEDAERTEAQGGQE
jgi:hypothetical protein